MSSDIYIDLQDVLSRPTLFKLTLDYNVGIRAAMDQYKEKDPDYHWIVQCMEPLLICQFGVRIDARPVEIYHTNHLPGDKEGVTLHVCCNASFTSWLMMWLADHEIKYTILPEN